MFLCGFVSNSIVDFLVDICHQTNAISSVDLENIFMSKFANWLLYKGFSIGSQLTFYRDGETLEVAQNGIKNSSMKKIRYIKKTPWSNWTFH